MALVLWAGCDNLDFADPNSPVVESANVQSLITGVEAGMRLDLDIYLRAISVVGREVYYLEPADPRYTGELLTGPMDGGGFLTTRPWNAHYAVIKNCNLILVHGDADAGAIGFAKTILAYNLLMVINMQDENGARLNYDGDINVDVANFAGNNITLVADAIHPADNKEMVNIGAEMAVLGLAKIRVGYKMGADEGGLAAGAGIKLPFANTSADVSYTDFGLLGSVFSMSIGLGF